MPKTIELFYAIQNEKPAIQIRIADTVEGSAKEKIREMLTDLPIPATVANSLSDSFQTRLLANEEVKVQNVQSKPESVQQSKPCSGSTKKKAKITESQLRTLRDLLAKNRISESAFCGEHGVVRLEELSSGAAWHILDKMLN